ncbi:MAG TPA: hypothetical protein VGR04_09865 [Acidimicrobiia bacterium]|jgi:hypothetical protein|nr:hypothetical protein [Acidimicrobiia bacterium]
MTTVHGEWLTDFQCLACGERGAGSAVVLGELALCASCAIDAAVEGLRDAESRDVDTLGPFGRD